MRQTPLFQPQTTSERRAAADPWARMPAVGFNPFRQHRRRPSDYVLVAAAFVVVAVLLLWAMMG